jgi:formylglycine-generating enzyme required for sulfatase activity
MLDNMVHAEENMYFRSVVVLLMFLAITASGSVQQPAIQMEMEFVRIPAGEFVMGCSNGDNTCADEEKPAHRVEITKAFEIGKYEVTQAQFEALMGRNYSEYKGPNRPVENVSWRDAQEFLLKLTDRQDGYRYRLPTEAEWEYAARAGSTAGFSGEPDDLGWYFENSNAQTHPVGQKKPNAWGIYDMHGNVWEWTADWYNPTYYQSSVSVDPAGPPTGRFRTMRGGSWVDQTLNARASKRDYFEDSADFHIGFRCVRVSTRQIVE